MKEIIYFEQAINNINKFPKRVRMRIAAMMDMLRDGLELPPKDFKPMPSVGKGIHELRIRVGMQYRVFYVTKFKQAIYVLHAFNKKTQKTKQHDIELGRNRYKELLSQLQEDKRK